MDINDYVTKKLDREKFVTLSTQEIQNDFNLTVKDALYLLAIMPYGLRLHSEYAGYVIIDNME